MKTVKLLVVACLLSIAQLNANDETLQRTINNITGNVEKNNELQLERINQPLCIFRTHSSKPTVTTFDPRKNEIKTVTCLPYDEKTKSFTTTKDRNNLAHLKTIRSKVFDIEGGSKVDKRYPGDRDAPLAVFLEDACKVISFIPSDEYKGIALIDEYTTGMPMKWVLASAHDLNGIQAYFEKNLKNADVTNKPLLLLELLNTTNELSDENITFLVNHFQLVDPTDATFKKFFNASNEAYLDAAENARDISNYVGESFGEKVFRQIEKRCHSLKMQEIIITGAVALTAGIACKSLYNATIKPIEDVADEKIKKTTGEIKGIITNNKNVLLAGGGLCAAGVIVKVLYDRAQKSSHDEFYKEASVIDQEIKDII